VAYFLFVPRAAAALIWFPLGKPLDGVKMPIFSGLLAFVLICSNFFEQY
jgi:hypothetical protein